MAAYAEAITRMPTAPELPTIAPRAHDTGFCGAEQSELRDVSHATNSLENTSYDPATWLNALRARSAMGDFGSMLIARSNWERARAE